MAAALGWWMQAREGDPRALAAAVLASVALHAALLLSLPGLRDWKPTLFPGPITARLVAPPSAVAPPAPVRRADETAKPGAERSPARPAPRARPAVPAPVELPSAVKPAAQDAPAPSGPPPGPEPAKPAAEAAQAALSVSASPAKSEPQPGAPAPGADEAGTLAQYRIAIIAAARRFKKYPRLALDNNWEGRVEVRMVIGANGGIAALSIRSSTGHEVLDQQALDMIRRAKPVTPIPAALRGREIAVDVPVIFSLREETSG